MWWKVLLFFWIAILSAIGIMTPIAGTFSDLAMMSQFDSDKVLPLKFHLRDGLMPGDEGGYEATGYDKLGNEARLHFSEQPVVPLEDGLFVDAFYNKDAHRVEVVRVRGSYPGFSFPFIPGLEERAKIIIYHVPMAWMSVIAFLVSMWYGILYLRKKDMADDARSAVSAGLGLLFTILATTTGSLWAKFNWGSFWNWDPRETSIFVLMMVYGAYFALRSAIDIEERKATLSAVYSILGAVSVPFFVFIMPRIMPGLHPGSADDVNSGPVLSSGGMDASMRVILYAMLAGYVVLYGWLMRIQMRLYRIKTQRAEAAA